MHYWLQQLQQKRWEFSNTRGSGHRDSWSSPITAHPPSGLVAKDKDNDASVFEKLDDSMEKVRSDLGLEAEGTVGWDSPSSRGLSGPPANPLNSLRNLGTELRNTMSYLRPGRAESRRSVFYTASSSGVDEWELLEPPSRDSTSRDSTSRDSTSRDSTSRDSTSRDSTRDFTRDLTKDCSKDLSSEGKHNEAHRHSFGSAFTFDFGRSSGRIRKPLLTGRLSRGSADVTAADCNGARPVDLRLQSLQDELSRVLQEQVQLREELLTSQELVRLLQQTLRTSQCDVTSLRGGSLTSDTNSCEQTPTVTPETERLLLDREAQVQSLCGHMERLALEKDSLQQELKGLKLKVGEMNEQLGMMMETIQAKDQVIMKLSQEPSSEAGQSEAGSPSYSRESDVRVLQDSLQGYKTQNKFLNKEILELTVLRQNAESREKTLEAKYTALEARLCQVESKYLVLLQEVKTPVCGSSEQRAAPDVISRLLEDALQGEGPESDQLQLKPHTVSEYDVFGFKTVPEEEEEEEKLVAKVRALELKSLSMTDQEVSVGVRWENHLAGTMNRALVRSPELKALVRCGVPHEHRSHLWRWCVSFHVKKLREHIAPDYYETLLNVAKEKPNPASKQIELDLLRTLPNNKHYASPSAPGIQKLRNVLTAFSWRNPDIGYCQGLNRLAAIALLYLDQEDAFWTLIAIVEVFMPRDYYTKTLLGSQVDQRVFKDLMSEKLPRLHAHFELHKVDFSLITFNWFLVVFVDSVVSDILFKIWDAFLYEGPKIIFRSALALFKYKEEEFLKLQDSTTIFKYLRYFTSTILDSRKLMTMAFVDMNPFPMRQIQSRRSFHLERVRLELSELEAIRQTFVQERDKSHDGRTFVSDDDDDN
uniref:Rab-GAP TBC domain-containing protein n=2 Tax=Knipowitschia caucasica TaxID=637954 RepID=A0AAV2L363_KNICA